MSLFKHASEGAHTRSPQLGPVVKKTTEASDGELVSRVVNGDQRAFEMIMRRYNQRLFRIARSILGEDDEAMDAVQEAYVKAYFQLSQFRGPQGFASWLSRIVTNESMMRIRKSARLQYTLDDPYHDQLQIESPEAQPLDQLAQVQLRNLLKQAVEQLSLGLRSVYVLRAVEQLTTRETAESLGLSEDVVKTRYRRAKAELRKTFRSHMDKSGLNSYEFAGHRCDAIVAGVVARIAKFKTEQDST